MTQIARLDWPHAAFLCGIGSRLQRCIGQDCENDSTAILRLSTLLCAALLITAPAFAGPGGSQRNQTSANAEIKEQKQDAETQS